MIAGFWALLGVSIAIYFLLTNDWQIKPAKVEILNQIGLWWMRTRPLIRAQGIHPNDAGGLMALLTPFLLAIGVRAWREKQIYFMTLTILGCFLISWGLLLTTSRGAWLAFCIAMGIWLIWSLSGFGARKFQWRQLSIFLAAVGLLGSLSLMLVILYPNMILSVLGSLPGPASAPSRLELFHNTTDLIADFPITGGGLRNFPGLYSQYILGIPFFYLIDSHNIFLDLALEQGIFGFLVVVIVFIGTIWILITDNAQMVSGIISNDLLRWAILTSLLVMCLHGLVDDYVYGDLGSPLLFFQAGMAISLTQLDSGSGDWKIAQSKQTSNNVLRTPNLTWKFLGVTAIVILLLAIAFTSRKALQSLWYSNQGSVEMAQIELVGWPTGQWDDGSNVALLDPAEGLFLQALLSNPNNRTANYRLGLIAMLKRDYITAVSDLESAYQIDQDHPGIRKALGYSYLWSGQFDKAMVFLSELPDSSQEVGTYIWFWENLGRRDLASIARNMVTQLESSVGSGTGNDPTP
jgi:hypothetical protein